MQNTNKKTEWNAISINGLMERPHNRQLNKTIFFYIKNLNMCLRNIYQGQKDTEQIHGKIQVRENPHSSIFSAVYLSSSSLCNSND